MDQQTARRPRIFATTGASLLLLTAAAHAGGFSAARDEVADPPVDQFIHDVLPGLWLFFSWHLVVVAAAVLWVTWRRRLDGRTMIVFTAAATIGAALWVGFLAGWLFPGTWLIVVAAGCLVAAAARWPNPAPDSSSTVRDLAQTHADTP